MLETKSEVITQVEFTDQECVLIREFVEKKKPRVKDHPELYLALNKLKDQRVFEVEEGDSFWLEVKEGDVDFNDDQRMLCLNLDMLRLYFEEHSIFNGTADPDVEYSEWELRVKDTNIEQLVSMDLIEMMREDPSIGSGVKLTTYNIGQQRFFCKRYEMSPDKEEHRFFKANCRRIVFVHVFGRQWVDKSGHPKTPIKVVDYWNRLEEIRHPIS